MISSDWEVIYHGPQSPTGFNPFNRIWTVAVQRRIDGVLYGAWSSYPGDEWDDATAEAVASALVSVVESGPWERFKLTRWVPQETKIILVHGEPAVLQE